MTIRAEYETLKVAIDAHRVGTVTMNRPEALNAMNTQMMVDLRDCFMAFYVDPDACACLILTGAGTRGFCTGADLKERRGMTDAVWRRQHAIVEQAVRAIMDCPIPIIAAVNGAAFAGGLELALACDFIYAADHARFALTEVTLGIMPGAAGTQNLPRAVGVRRAKEIILAGQPFTSADAQAWGLTNRVVPGDQLMAEVITAAARIAANAPISVRQAKLSIHRGLQSSLRDGLALEIEAYNRMVPTEDRREGVLAFNEKRKPDFKGR